MTNIDIITNIRPPMLSSVSEKQLEEWRIQHTEDMKQYRKDEEYLQKLEEGEEHRVRTFFDKVCHHL